MKKIEKQNRKFPETDDIIPLLDLATTVASKNSAIVIFFSLATLGRVDGCFDHYWWLTVHKDSDMITIEHMGIFQEGRV